MHRVLFPPAHIANDVKHILSIIVISIAVIAGVCAVLAVVLVPGFIQLTIMVI